jgi:predicted nucleic acid-binding Zn ribbon protein
MKDRKREERRTILVLVALIIVGIILRLVLSHYDHQLAPPPNLNSY